jgi:hypothetical protein
VGSLHSSVVGPVIVAKAVLTDLFEMNNICDQFKYSLLKLILPATTFKGAILSPEDDHQGRHFWRLS